MQKIVTNLWFDGRVEEALEFYTGIFANSRVTDITRYGDEGPGRKGDIMVAAFELEGQSFMIINGGPGFPHSPAISLLVHCEDQAELDRLWDRLTEGGRPDRCGWLTDRFGIAWQIVPVALQRLLQSGDEAQVRRVTQALLAMGKLDIAALEQAYHGQ